MNVTEIHQNSTNDRLPPTNALLSLGQKAADIGRRADIGVWEHALWYGGQQLDVMLAVFMSRALKTGYRQVSPWIPSSERQ
jgi:hypothetical protein